MLPARTVALEVVAEPLVIAPLAGNVAAKDCSWKTKERKRSETNIACPFAATGIRLGLYNEPSRSHTPP